MVLASRRRNGIQRSVEETLWLVVDKLRGHMDAASYKHIVLGLIFLKYIAEHFHTRYQALHEQGLDAEDRIQYQLWLPPEARWPYLMAQAQTMTDLGACLDRAMRLIESHNPQLKNALPKDYARSTLAAHRLAELLTLIGQVALVNEDEQATDVLGSLYECLLGRFASLEGKNGEFYTSPTVAALMVELLEPLQGRVYDPCCGTGGMFLQAQRFVRMHGGEGTRTMTLYGQEMNATTWRLCRMNLAVHGLVGALGERAADTFHENLHPSLLADYILANPPFNVSDWGAQHLHADARWRYGVPSNDNANTAWLQHCIAHLAPTGLACIVLTNGSLSGGNDVALRRALLEADLVDCIVALPTQLFANTQVAASLWLLARDKRDPRFRGRCGQTLFIHAQHLGIMRDRVHRVLTDEDISAIAGAYHAWRAREQVYVDVPGFCASAMLAEIAAHNWALVPGRYVGFANSSLPSMDIERVHTELAGAELWLERVAGAANEALATVRDALHG